MRYVKCPECGNNVDLDLKPSVCPSCKLVSYSSLALKLINETKASVKKQKVVTRATVKKEKPGLFVNLAWDVSRALERYVSEVRSEYLNGVTGRERRIVLAKNRLKKRQIVEDLIRESLERRGKL